MTFKQFFVNFKLFFTLTLFLLAGWCFGGWIGLGVVATLFGVIQVIGD